MLNPKKRVIWATQNGNQPLKSKKRLRTLQIFLELRNKEVKLWMIAVMTRTHQNPQLNKNLNKR